MKEYKSRYKELGFYVKGEQKRFAEGRYLASTKEEIEVLDKLADAVSVEKEVPKEVAKPKAESKPTRKKASVK